MQSEDIDEDDEDNAGIIVHHEDDSPIHKRDDFIIHNSILLAVFFGAFVLWNCGSAGIMSVFKTYVPPVWEFKDGWDIFIFEVGALVSAGFQLIIFMAVCGAINAIGVHMNKNQHK